MFGSAVLDTAIGLIFVFFTVSTICSSLFSYISRLKKTRGKLLQRGLLYLLGNDVRRRVMNHPLIRDLELKSPVLPPLPEQTGPRFRSNPELDKVDESLTADDYPDWIPADVFAEALVEVIFNTVEQRIVEEVISIAAQRLEVDRRLSSIEPDVRALLEVSEDKAYQLIDKWIDRLNSQFANAIDEETRWQIHAKVEELFGYREDVLAFLRRGIEELDLPYITRDFLIETLQSVRREKLFDDFQERTQEVLAILHERYLDDVLKTLQGWYNRAANSLTPIFKRYSQIWIYGTAILITLVFNINTIAITETLWTSPTVREAIVAEAETVEDPSNEESRNPIEIYNEELALLNIPVGWTEQELEELGLPDFLAYAEDPSRKPLSTFNLLLGWVATIFAAGAGAPFWFDVLNRLLTLRRAARRDEEK